MRCLVPGGGSSVVTLSLALGLFAPRARAQEFRFVRTVSTGTGTEASYYDSERGHVAVFNPSGAGRFLRPDGTLLREVSAPSTGFLDAAAYDTVQHRALFLTQDCTLTEAEPVTLASLASRRLGHGMSVCAGLGVGRDNNLYIASYGTNEVVVLDRTGVTLVRRVALAALGFSGIDGLAYIPGSDNILIVSSTGSGAMVISPLGAAVVPRGAISVAGRPLGGTEVSVPDGLTSLCANGHVWLCEAYLGRCYDYQQTTGDQSRCGCHESAGPNVCSGGTPVCDDETNACRGCRADAECLGVTPACDLATGRCVACTAMNATACVAPTARCDAAARRCVGCLSGADCRDATPVCDATTQACRACGVDAECAGATPACGASGACVECTERRPERCAGATPVCGPTSRCVLCTPGALGDARACAANPDGRACVAGPAGVLACGCAADGDCGDATSGRVCDPGTRRCADGCSPAPGRNGCPAGRFCTSDDLGGARVGRCTVTCNFDRDCAATMPAAPYCLSGGDGGTSTCVACREDSDCGAVNSGRVCNEAHACIAGCRGAGGNGCPIGLRCSSSDRAPGVCAAPPDAALGDLATDAAGDSVPERPTDVAADTSLDGFLDTLQDSGVPVAMDLGMDTAPEAVVPADLPREAGADAPSTPTIAVQRDGCGCRSAVTRPGGRSWALLVGAGLARLRRPRRPGRSVKRPG